VVTRCRCYILPVTKEANVHGYSTPYDEPEFYMHESVVNRLDEIMFKSMTPLHTPPYPPSGGDRYFTLEAPMNPNQRALTLDEIFSSWYRPATYFSPVKTPQQLRNEAFAKLDVQNGDVIELVHDINGKNAATLAGTVAQVRQVDGEYQVRVEGFGETPHGNHNTWFAVGNYEVKVFTPAYRWTADDKLVVAIAGGTLADRWPTLSERDRELYRSNFAQSAARVRKALEVR